MDKPKVAAKTPAVLELEPGTYWWCACGRSTNQPWCNGAHEGTPFSPVELHIEETRKVALCRCKQTASPPYCDGAHRDL